MKTYILAVILLIIASCSIIEKKDEGIIEEEKFVDVLVDIHFADAVVIVKGFRYTNDSARIDLFYDDVLKKHNISRSDLEKTINYYSKNIADYDRLYEQVLEKLTKMQGEYNEEKEPKKLDE